MMKLILRNMKMNNRTMMLYGDNNVNNGTKTNTEKNIGVITCIYSPATLQSTPNMKEKTSGANRPNSMKKPNPACSKSRNIFSARIGNAPSLCALADTDIIVLPVASETIAIGDLITRSANT